MIARDLSPDHPRTHTHLWSSLVARSTEPSFHRVIWRRVAVVTVLATVLAGLAAPSFAGKFTPRPGPTFNSAVGNNANQQKIINKINRTIRSTPRGENIEIMSWNMMSPPAVDAMLRAQRRGVRVRLLMAKGNVSRIDNPSFQRLRRELRQHNRGRARARHSWARVCVQSCRGRGGAAHAKYYLFSKSGRAEDVVIQGSANLTTAAANNQWNDIITQRDSKGVYRFMRQTFYQMAKDKPTRPTYVTESGNGIKLAFFPSAGKNATDPVMQLLNRVHCRRATNTGGRTRIRVAPDSLRQDRGNRLARKLRSLWIDGCDVKIGYTVIGIDTGRMLRAPSRRGPVPLAHMVQDANNDGQFDNYFHMKAMTIVGNVGKNRGAWVTMNGSANWSNAATISDENFGFYYRKGITQTYEDHLNYWYNFFSSRGRAAYRGETARAARADGRLTDDGLLFGIGPIDGVDPYANLELD